MIRHVIEENLEKRHLRDLEYRMLDGSLSNDEENEVAGMLGLNDAEIYRVVTFRMDAIKNMEKFTNAQIKETEGVTEELKAKDQLAWVGHMNSIRHWAEEVIRSEMIFV